MQYAIYQIIKDPRDKEWIDADFLCDFPYLMVQGTQAEDVEDRESELSKLAKWLHDQKLGGMERNTFVLNASFATSPYFAQQYEGFRKIVSELSEISEEDFLYNYRYVRDRATELFDSVVHGKKNLVCVEMAKLIPLDDFLRTAKPNVPYYIGGICTYQL